MAEATTDGVCWSELIEVDKDLDEILRTLISDNMTSTSYDASTYLDLDLLDLQPSALAQPTPGIIIVITIIIFYSLCLPI